MGTKYYYAGSVRVAVRVGTVLDYLFSDHLGSTSITADSSGNLAGGMRYTAWGETRFSGGATPTTFRYTGQRQAEAGLYYYVARMYDPYLNRFLSPDSIIPNPSNPLGWDRYSYGLNNPLRYNDPSGHMADDGCDTEGCNVENQPQSFMIVVNTLFDRPRNWNELPEGYKSVLSKGGVTENDYALSEMARKPGVRNAYWYENPLVWISLLFGTTVVFGPAVISSIVPFFSGLSSTPQVLNRAVELHDSLKTLPYPHTFNMTTTAVLTTEEGVTLVASSESSLASVQRSLLLPNEIEVLGQTGVHAEQKLIIAATSCNLTPNAMYISRSVCPTCQMWLNYFNIPSNVP